MKVLTDLDQLVGKRIIFIDKHDVMDSSTLYVTEDKCVLLESKYLSSSCGVDYIEREYASTMMEIYEELDYSLVEWNIISLDEYNQLELQWKFKQEAEDNKRKESQRQLRYEDYLRLKKEFEVEYKLD